MKLDRAFSRRRDAFVETHVAESNRVLVVVVDACERSVFSEVIVRRIPHLRDWIVGIADASVNLVLIVFPEALVCLPAEFARRIVNALRYCFVEVVGEIVIDLTENRQRNVADAVVGLQLSAFAVFEVSDRNGYAIVASLDVQYFRFVLNEFTDFAFEAIDDFVHASHRLEERGLPFVFKRLIKTVIPKLRAEQFSQRQLFVGIGCTALVDGDRAAVTCGAAVFVTGRALLVASDALRAARIALATLCFAALG